MRHLTQIIVAAFCPASPILQKQIGHFPNTSFRLKAALPAACGLPSGEDGRGRESRIDALARASGRAATATRGRLFCFGDERAKPLAFPRRSATEATASLSRASGTKTAPSQRRDAAGGVAASRARDKAVAHSAAPQLEASARPSPARQEERRERQRVSTRTPRPQEREARDRARPSDFPLSCPLPIVTRMGRDDRLGRQSR